MLDRVATAAAPLRLVCVALLVFLIAQVSLVGRAIDWRPSTPAVATASAVRCTHGLGRTLRTRSSGLHQRFLTRDFAARRPLLQLDE